MPKEIQRRYRPVMTLLSSKHPATPEPEMDDGALRICKLWNKVMPHGIWLLTQPRYDNLRAILVAFTPDEVCNAIGAYSNGEWQQRNKMWRKFDRFFEIEFVTRWVEEAIEEEERLRLDEVRHAEDARRKAAKVAAKKKQKQVREKYRQEFSLLPDDEKRKYLAMARKGLPTFIDGERIAEHAITLYVKSRIANDVNTGAPDSVGQILYRKDE